jgi:hypothetical protein
MAENTTISSSSGTLKRFERTTKKSIHGKDLPLTSSKQKYEKVLP